MTTDARLYCGYCHGAVAYDQECLIFRHVDAGDRVTPGVAGDYVSAAHNRAGTPVNPVDVEEASDDQGTRAGAT